jgi:2-methylisocitrate lyase-like PEP mutase family enzyme
MTYGPCHYLKGLISDASSRGATNVSSHRVAEQQIIEPTDLESQCGTLRSMHVPGTPLVLPNAWDAASARAVVAAGFPVVATTSAGVAASLGYEDHQRAPADEMLAAAARIATAVNVPVTVDAEAGYGLKPANLVARLKKIGAAGCNLEDTNHATGEPRDPVEQAEWLRAVRAAASDQRYGLVINARIDVFFSALLSGAQGKGQAELVSEALRRAHAYVAAGADCVFPILLWELDALESFIAGAPGPVNVLQIRPAPSHAKLAQLGVARISYGGLLHHDAMEQFGGLLQSLPGAPAD